MNKYLDQFMNTFPFEGLTYDDVTLVTQYADFLPDDASLETRLTSRTRMKIPFISAAMDTVTEAPMAIAMALAGGIGVINKNLEDFEQAEQVKKDTDFITVFADRMANAVRCPVAREIPDNVKEKLDEYLLRKRPKS